MIIVECPHCGKEHILLSEEIEELTRGGKVVVASCKCDKLYTVYRDNDDDDCIFAR